MGICTVPSQAVPGSTMDGWMEGRKRQKEKVVNNKSCCCISVTGCSHGYELQSLGFSDAVYSPPMQHSAKSDISGEVLEEPAWCLIVQLFSETSASPSSTWLTGAGSTNGVADCVGAKVPRTNVGVNLVYLDRPLHVEGPLIEVSRASLRLMVYCPCTLYVTVHAPVDTWYLPGYSGH